MIRKLAFAAAVFAAGSAPLSAQVTSGSLEFVSGSWNGHSVSDGTYLVGPYTGDVTGGALAGQTVSLNCVDFFHEVTTGDQWNIYETSLTGGDLSHTRLGTSSALSTQGTFNDLQMYEQAAYLTTLYTGATNTQTVNIQHAIWGLLGNTTYYVSDPGGYITLARNNFASAAVDYTQFYVLTDSRVYDPPNYDDRLTKQEFLVRVTSTPEPSSMALLGTGLFGLVPMLRRRRKQ